MPRLTYECIPLKWDTEYFGVKSARVNLMGLVDTQDQEEIIKFCEKFDFVTISNHDNRKENNYWIGNKTNAFLVDMNIQFIKELTVSKNYMDEATYVVNKYVGNERVIEIANESFQYSRFFNDDQLSQKRKANIYSEWTKSAFEQVSKYFVICEINDRIAGYILFSFSEDSSVIELIAVDKKYQGKGVGKSLVKTMETFIMGKGINKIKVGTQVDNISAAQFYGTMGFKYISCGSNYHLWKS